MKTSDKKYKPHCYKNIAALTRVLKAKVLINESDIKLNDTDIETLSLGLGFIPTNDDNDNEGNREITLDKSIESWKNKLDIMLYFAARKGLKLKSNKGWLWKEIKSDWVPTRQAWRDDETVNSINIITEQYDKSTITPQKIRESIRKLKKLENVHILSADKGSNTVLWRETDYNKEAIRQLTDTNSYRELTENEYNTELAILTNTCKQMAVNLFQVGSITKREAEVMAAVSPSGSNIYFLPKIHKPKNPVSQTFAGRPIVATHSATVHLLDKLLANITSPLLSRIPNSMKDTTDFLKQTTKIITNTHTECISADVNSLYPSIPWNEGIAASVNFYAQQLQWLRTHAKEQQLPNPPPVGLFKRILELVLQNSYIEFKGIRFFHQTCGTAMGMCISVYFANCYMYHITRVMIHNPPTFVKLFVRFIDDIFLVTESAHDQDIETFFNSISNEKIKYTIERETDGMQNFLDTTIINHRNGEPLQSTAYWKATASGSFLHPSSNHPWHIIKSIPYSQLLRIRRICSTDSLFKTAAKRTMSDLKRTGYTKGTVQRAMKEVMSGYSRDKNNTTDREIRCIAPYDGGSGIKISNKAIQETHKNILEFYKDQNKPEFVKALSESSSSVTISVGKRMGEYFSPVIKKGHKTV